MNTVATDTPVIVVPCRRGESLLAVVIVVVLLIPATAGLSSASSMAAQSKPSPLEGRWVSTGRVSQQNWILKVRDNRIWGLVCGPCTGDVVAMIDDGRIEGNTVTFYINHIDTPPSAQRKGVQRNVMKGTITNNPNVIKFTYFREDAPDQPGGEIVMIGPIR